MSKRQDSNESLKSSGKREYFAEDYLQKQLDDLYLYLNRKMKNAFDEHIEIVEGIMFQKKDIKEEMLDYKRKLFGALYLKMTEVSYNSQEIGSALRRQRYEEKMSNKLEWQFRRDYLQFIVEKFFDKEFIRFVRPDYAKLRGVKKNGLYENPS